jgi:hypothetical protein
MKTQELLWNKYSRAIGVGGAAIAILGGIFTKKSTGIIASNAIYVGAFGIIIGSVIYSLKSPSNKVV